MKREEKYILTTIDNRPNYPHRKAYARSNGEYTGWTTDIAEAQRFDYLTAENMQKYFATLGVITVIETIKGEGE